MVGFFLFIRQTKRANKWTNFLIIAVMLFAFLNVVVVNGVLVGLVEGSSRPYREHYSGDVLISPAENNKFIKKTDRIAENIQSIDKDLKLTKRYFLPVQIEANYTEKVKSSELIDKASSRMIGIDPAKEDEVTQLSDLLVDGEYLDNNDLKEILVGSNLLEQYSRGVPGEETLKNVFVGSKVRATINQKYYEFVVKGIVESKISEIGSGIFINENLITKIRGRGDDNAEEIAVKLDKISPEELKQKILNTGIDQEDASVETWRESQGQFLEDISSTFNILGLLIGMIGITVASITVFIVIFINALNRKKYIGILKGIGICSQSIEIAYIFQALFYALVGTAIGLVTVYSFLKPYLDANPIDFPFSDGILFVPLSSTLIRIGFLFFITFWAGYLPAKIIVRKNTLDAILDR